VTHFLVERYVPAVDGERLPTLAAMAAAAAEEMRARGTEIRYLWSAFLPADEICLCLFEAGDRAAVEEVNRRAGFAFERVVEAVRVRGD